MVFIFIFLPLPECHLKLRDVHIYVCRLRSAELPGVIRYENWNSNNFAITVDSRYLDFDYLE